jgi:hypothetical protein
MTTNVKGKALATGVKGKTKASGAKGKTKATGLKEFLSNLAIDPRKLGEFLHEPEAAMSAANVSEGDKTALRSGVAGMVAARLAGVPLDQAFQPPSQLMAQVTPPPPYVAQAMPPPPYVAHIPPPPYVAQATLPPAYPPQFVVYPPPQFVVQSPPYYPR